MTFGHLGYCDALEKEVARLVPVLADADWNATVPTCPDWSMVDLIHHLGQVHRWAGTMVAELSQDRLPRERLNWHVPDDPSELPAWIEEGAKELDASLRNADPDAPMWAWGADQHARFWSRRQLHETAVHRADAAFTLALNPLIDDAVAIDGVDEFLENLPSAKRFRPEVDNLRGTGESLSLRCDGATWHIELLPDRFVWRRDDADADVTIEAAPADLVLFVYGRRKPDDTALKIAGDRAILDRWVENSKL